jgi:hypothetical protein
MGRNLRRLLRPSPPSIVDTSMCKAYKSSLCIWPPIEGYLRTPRSNKLTIRQFLSTAYQNAILVANARGGLPKQRLVGLGRFIRALLMHPL